MLSIRLSEDSRPDLKILLHRTTSVMFVGKRGYYIPTAQLSRKRLKEIQTELTVKPVLTVEFQKPKPFKVYEMDGEYIIVPRAWGSTTFGSAPYTGRAGTSITVDRSPTFKLDPTRSQPEAVDAIMKTLQNEYAGGLACLYTGAGKTVIINWIIAELRLKTLVVVHKSFLLSQWRDRFAQFLPNAKVGVIQGSTINLDCDICIGMLQSLSMKEYAEDVFDGFGLVVFDECHLINTRVFQQAIKKVTTRFMIGLTATPQRKDQLQCVMHWHIGPPIFTATRENMTANVFLVYTDISEAREIINERTKKVDRVAMITEMIANDDRNKLVVDLVTRCCEENRKILVLSERRDHLDTLLAMLAVRGITSTGKYVGSMSEEQLKTSESCQVILGTYSMASTGLDIKDMDTLIMATPLTDVVQASGRILRNVTTNEKRIFDIVDRFSLFIGQMRARVRGYHKQNFTVSGEMPEVNTNVNTIHSLQITE